jgi:hypothetical protein
MSNDRHITHHTELSALRTAKPLASCKIQVDLQLARELALHYLPSPLKPSAISNNTLLSMASHLRPFLTFYPLNSAECPIR